MSAVAKRAVHFCSVTREEVVQALGDWLRSEFGKLVVLREMRRVRRAAGGTWIARVVIPANGGDIPVSSLEVDDEGNVVNPFGLEQLLEIVRRPPEEKAAFSVSDLGELMDFGDEEPVKSTDDLDALSGPALYAKAAALAASADERSLRRARDLMPRLLADPEQKGAVLVWMAVIERKLGDNVMALTHLEAAAREFADRFDLNTLEKLSALARELMGSEAHETSLIRRLLEDGREKLRPVDSIFECPQFYTLPENERDWLWSSLVLRKLAANEDLVREGEPSRNVFVVKSGLLGVHLETPEGGTRLVRSCFPGWLLGESSVLVDDDPRCSATLRAERPSEVWVIDASVLKDGMKSNAGLRHRIEATKSLHRIDSFFSMHESLSQLEAIVRDELLACIKQIQVYDEDTLLVPADERPSVAALILRGAVEVHEGPRGAKPPVAVIDADRFLGVRDAMHAIAPATSATAKAGAMLALFDAEMLRVLAEKSPEAVVAVLERLG